MQFTTSKDTNPIVGSMAYYDIIEEIWEVDYTKFFVLVFKYKWVDNKSGVKIDESGLTLVDFRKICYRNKPFIMVQQASQVFYVKTLVCCFTRLKNKGRLLMIMKMVIPVHSHQ